MRHLFCHKAKASPFVWKNAEEPSFMEKAAGVFPQMKEPLDQICRETEEEGARYIDRGICGLKNFEELKKTHELVNDLWESFFLPLVEKEEKYQRIQDPLQKLPFLDKALDMPTLIDHVKKAESYEIQLKPLAKIIFRYPDGKDVEDPLGLSAEQIAAWKDALKAIEKDARQRMADRNKQQMEQTGAVTQDPDMEEAETEFEQRHEEEGQTEEETKEVDIDNGMTKEEEEEWEVQKRQWAEETKAEIVEKIKPLIDYAGSLSNPSEVIAEINRVAPAFSRNHPELVQKIADPLSRHLAYIASKSPEEFEEDAEFTAGAEKVAEIVEDEHRNLSEKEWKELIEFIEQFLD